MFGILCLFFFFFFFNDTATTEIYTLSLHDALPILASRGWAAAATCWATATTMPRSEEHTSELQSHSDIVCRLLLEKKKTSIHQERRAISKNADKHRFHDVGDD